MAVIAFSKKTGEDWVVAGWAFRQVLDDIASHHPEDSEMLKEFEEAKAIGSLMVYALQPNLAARVATAIRETAVGIVSGTVTSGIVDKPFGHKETLEEYRKGLQQLLEAIPPSLRVNENDKKS